ncbi:hypothetical protein AB3S75_023030 [Citrus x aurantiifolia]
MGGCASKPKEFDSSPNSAPAEAPISLEKAESETNNNAQEKTNGGENQNEAPLVDLSKPKKEVEEPSRTKDIDVELASTENKAETNTSVDVTEKKVEAAIEPTEKGKDKSDAPLVTV